MSDRDFLSAFKAPATGRLFTWLVLLVCALLLLARSYLGDFDVRKVLSAIIEALLGTFLGALGISAFLRYFAPRSTHSEISILEARDLNQEFARLLGTSSSWRYKGNFGRWFRTKALSSLSYRAKDEHREIEVSCIVIDPEDVKLCELHAQARNSVRTADGKEDWTADDVRREVYATIVCCFAYRATLTVRLGLLNYFEPQRFDIAATSAIITREDRKAPAVRLNENGYFFEAASRDYANAFEQCRRIAIDRNKLSLSNLKKDEVLEVLRDAGLEGDFLTREIAKICEKASSKKNPYE
jgi:hypothetical protein